MANGAHLRGVITDWGGVLTTPILTTVQAWIQTEGIDWDSYRTGPVAGQPVAGTGSWQHDAITQEAPRYRSG
ncbi:MAG TPA: hypothetical protein VMK84_09255 [Streptosporangiaceae bacterium]|nr:hypothetical protein [Streptosporangiaceae bacterium]